MQRAQGHMKRCSALKVAFQLQVFLDSATVSAANNTLPGEIYRSPALVHFRVSCKDFGEVIGRITIYKDVAG